MFAARIDEGARNAPRLRWDRRVGRIIAFGYTLVVFGPAGRVIRFSNWAMKPAGGVSQAGVSVREEPGSRVPSLPPELTTAEGIMNNSTSVKAERGLGSTTRRMLRFRAGKSSRLGAWPEAVSRKP